MKPASKKQVKVRVAPERSLQVQRYCAAHGCTQQALMDAALEQYLGADGERALLMRRLDRLSQSLHDLVAANVSLGEAFGTFVQLWLGHNPEIPEARREAARRDAARRYRAFTQHVVRSIGDGRTLIGQLSSGGDAPAAHTTEGGL